jgi:hypothetical protein
VVNKRTWTKPQAHRYLRLVWRQLNSSWVIRFRYSHQPPKWVGDDTDILGCMQLEAPEQKIAFIWIQPDQPIYQMKIAIVHECLHVLFASAGIDCTTLRDTLRQTLSHQIVETLAPLLVNKI